MNYPSVKTLQKITGVDATKAKAIRAVLTGKREESLKYKSANEPENHSYHSQANHTLKLYAINEIIEGYGVEAIDLPEGSFNNCQTPDVCIEYVNLGDTYTTTLCRVERKGKVTYRVSDWGSIVERCEVRQ